MKKVKQSLLFFVVIFSLLFSSFGCSNNNPYEEPEGEYEVIYSVRFESYGGTYVATQRVSENEKVKEPTAPVKKGFVFIAWYYDGREWDFNQDTVTSNITLTAVWEEAGWSGDFPLQ